MESSRHRYSRRYPDALWEMKDQLGPKVVDGPQRAIQGAVSRPRGSPTCFWPSSFQG